MTPRLTVCVLACNEEEDLAPCLDSVAWADEIVIVIDAKSCDGSEKIACERATRVEVRRHEGDIEQKSFCVGMATGEWVLILDPDEVVSDELQREIQRCLAAGGSCSGFELDRCTYHLGRWIRHGDFYPDWTLRLFRRADAHWVGQNPHGRIAVDGATARLSGSLEHYSYRDLADQVERIQFFSDQAARALQAPGRRAGWSDLCLRPPTRFLRGYLLKRGFLDGVPGLVIAGATAFHVFLKYAKLWELQRGAPLGGGSSADA